MFVVSQKPKYQKKFLVKRDIRVVNMPKEKEKPHFSATLNLPPKRFKIRLSVIRDVPYQPKIDKKKGPFPKDAKIKKKRKTKEGSLNCGRWKPEEHKRFIEAIFKFGNEWKLVQKHVGTRSSTQARSHAQKFFIKLKRARILDVNFDHSKNFIKTLYELGSTMTSEQYIKAIQALNIEAFERKGQARKKSKKEDNGACRTDCGMNDAQSTLNFNSDEIFNVQSLIFQAEGLDSLACMKNSHILVEDSCSLMTSNQLSIDEQEMRSFIEMKNPDDMEYIDHFNCTFKERKNEFEVDKDLEDVIMLSYSHGGAAKTGKDERIIIDDFMSLDNLGNSR